MPDIPIHIDDAEVIVRAIFEPYHEKKGKLKPAAFRSPPGIDEVSVIRHTYMGTQFCKYKAKEIETTIPKQDPQKKYRGFAVVKALQIRMVKSDVVDSRNQFPGHADIKHGIILERDEPPNSETKMKLDERLKTLVGLTNYFRDQSPDKASDAARRKKVVRVTEDALPIHSFTTLLAELGTLASSLPPPIRSGKPSCCSRHRTDSYPGASPEPDPNVPGNSQLK